MSFSSAQADAFYREIIRESVVWGIEDDGGIPAPLKADGRRAMPFWSLRSRAQRVIDHVEAYRGFRVLEISLATFEEYWLPGMEKDGLLVGLNWSGANATGYDVEPADVADRLRITRGS